MGMVTFLNALFTSTLEAVFLLAVVVLAVICGKKLRDNSDQKKSSI